MLAIIDRKPLVPARSGSPPSASRDARRSEILRRDRQILIRTIARLSSNRPLLAQRVHGESSGCLFAGADTISVRPRSAKACVRAVIQIGASETLSDIFRFEFQPDHQANEFQIRHRLGMLGRSGSLFNSAGLDHEFQERGRRNRDLSAISVGVRGSNRNPEELGGALLRQPKAL
jgi:hypothetical protein